MMNRYFQNSKFFEWLRERVFKVNKPFALQWGGWEKWYEEFKSDRPLAHWFTETLPRWLDKPVQWLIDPVESMMCYFRNRYISQTHLLRTGLESGQWHELENRILHGMFTQLVDFVEIEQARHHVLWMEAAERGKYNEPTWRKFWLLRIARWRCPEAGIDYLTWCMTLDGKDAGTNSSPGQATLAREIMFLYSWWKDIRPNRKSELEESGLLEFEKAMSLKYGQDWVGFDRKKILTPAEKLEHRRLLDLSWTIEEQRHQEDDELMIRLIKIRRGLWT